MAGRRKNPLWREVFLRALARTGNARASAVEAGIDVGTAYDHRAKDPAFMRRWAAALEGFKKREALRGRPGRAGGSAKTGGELVLRRTKHGDKMVRAAPGRWSRRLEESFFDGLEHTGCVRAAAAAAGISTASLYERRKHYPEFATRWDEVAGRAARELPAMLGAAAVESLANPPPPAGAKRRGRSRLPRIDVDQAIRISQIAAREAGKGQRRGRPARPEVSEEDLTAALLKQLGALRRRRRKARLEEGWSEAEDGAMIPPGWIRAPDAGEPGPDGGA